MTIPRKRENVLEEADEFWEVVKELSHYDISESEARTAQRRVSEISDLFVQKGWFGPKKSKRVAKEYICCVYSVPGSDKIITFRGSTISSDSLAKYHRELGDAINRDLGYDPENYDLDSCRYGEEGNQKTPGHDVGKFDADPLKKHYNV